MAYAINYPYLEPYLSLYAKGKKPKDGQNSGDEDSGTTLTAKEALHAERPAMWTTVEEALREGDDALQKLRERDTQAQPSSRKKADKSGEASATGPADDKEMSGVKDDKDSSEDDGVFFEE